MTSPTQLELRLCFASMARTRDMAHPLDRHGREHGQNIRQVAWTLVLAFTRTTTLPALHPCPGLPSPPRSVADMIIIGR
jgi:hypothetical protein